MEQRFSKVLHTEHVQVCLWLREANKQLVIPSFGSFMKCTMGFHVTISCYRLCFLFKYKKSELRVLKVIESISFKKM